jgi:hypothetical protein
MSESEEKRREQRLMRRIARDLERLAEQLRVKAAVLERQRAILAAKGLRDLADYFEKAKEEWLHS